MTVWSSAILQKCLLQGLSLTAHTEALGLAIIQQELAVKKFTIDYFDESTSRLLPFHAKQLRHLVSGMPNLQKLILDVPPTLTASVRVPVLLTYLRVDGSHLKLEIPTPSCLTYLDTTSQLELKELPQSLTHLDAPDWLADFSNFRCCKHRFQGFKKLSFRLYNIRVSEIPGFLSHDFFDTKSLLNLNLSIKYSLSGTILPKATSVVTWDILVRITEKKIEKLLRAPVPLDSSVSSIPKSKSTLRSLIKSFTLCERQCSVIRLPTGAQEIRIRAPLPWSVALKVAYSSFPSEYWLVFTSLRQLTHLEMRNVRFDAQLIRALPQTLRFFLVTTDSQVDSIGASHLPSNLEVFMLDIRPKRAKDQTFILPFTGSWFPKSLKHLCITSDFLQLGIWDSISDSQWNFPNLESLLLAGFEPGETFWVYKKLSMLTLDNPDILESNAFVRTNRFGYPSPRIHRINLTEEQVISALKHSAHPAHFEFDDIDVERAFEAVYKRALRPTEPLICKPNK